MRQTRRELAQSPQSAQLYTTIADSPRVFISYKRNTRLDARLARRLYTDLKQIGHEVFIDQTMKVGVDWAEEIQRQIEVSDFVVVLLSEASVQSEMLAKEVECAHRHFLRTGQPRLLPVRVNYTDPLPYQLSSYLDNLQYAEWRRRSRGNTQRLVAQLLDVIGYGDSLPPLEQVTVVPTIVEQLVAVVPPPPAADPRIIDPKFVASLNDPSGALRLHSAFYVERTTDQRLRLELSKPNGTTTTIRASRQTGKSSLLIRGVAHAQQQNSKVVFIDLQPVDATFLQTLEAFLRYIATIIVVRLGMNPESVDKIWTSSLGASDKITNLMEEYILPQIPTRLVLAIDEADRVLGAAFHTEFFSLLRFWHNKRAMIECWDKLSILIVISTEPHLLIRDLNQSPFNVGLKIRLEDFNDIQVKNLNLLYQSPLQAREISALQDLLNGHPYLTNKALYTLVTDEMTWDRLNRIASTDRGPFGDHLRRYLWLLNEQLGLMGALKQIILHERCSDDLAFYQLSQAGLIKGYDSQSCMCRCKLYEMYFRGRL